MKRAVGIAFLCVLLPLVAWAQYDTLVFSVPGGFYDEVFTLELQCGNPQNHIHYTTNGCDPTAQSPLYTEPLVLDERMYSKSDIYTIVNCPEDQFILPDHVDHCIVIRAAVFDDNGQYLSETLTNSYFIRALGCDLHGLPAVSLCVDSTDLFNYDTGIFVAGANYDPEQPRWTGNYYQRGKEWERWANFEFYEYDNSGVNQQCGVRTHGGNGRRFHQKTMKVFAREKYGKKHFKHRFFTNLPQRKFKALVLRPFLSSNAGCEDYICNRLAQQLNLDFMADRPSVLFLNGEYWGIYYVKEKPDEHYVEDHYGIESDSVNLQWGWWGNVENGDPEKYKALQGWTNHADLSDPEQYAYIETQIDIDNFIDYYLLELFVANFDWPINNVRFWQAGDTKFRWMFFDGDSGLENLQFDVFANAIKDDVDNYKVSTFFFRKFLESPQFQERFARRFNQLIVSTFSFENTHTFFDTIKAVLDPETHRQFERFGPPEDFYPSNYDVWLNGHMKMTIDFLKVRPTQNFLSMPKPQVTDMNCYHLTDEVILQAVSNSFGSDAIRVYDLKGKKVYSQACVLATGVNLIKLNAHLPAGAYLVTVGGCAQKIVWL